MSKTIRPMTDGSIAGHLVRYAVPAILGDLFQVTYNTVDAIVVGRFAGAGALAAVGIANPLMNIATFFIIGLGIGASVLMSGFFGANDGKSLKREFSTAMAAGIGCSFAVAMLLFVLAQPLLTLCRTPDEILADTAAYLRIVAFGMVFTGAYNMLSAGLKAVGDTKTPLLCLIAASLVNVGLDLLFVDSFGMGVRGAAYATTISQGVSAVLIAALLYRNAPPLRLAKGEFTVDKTLLKKTVSLSYASALQQAGVYVGKLVVQTLVNPLGISAIAAFNAVNRIDDYALIPERDIASGMTVLIAQNRGAKKPERMTGGLKTGLLLESVYGCIVSLCVFLFARPLMELFANEGETEVVQLGMRYLHIIGFFYFLPGITNGLQGYMRAVGRMRLTMYVTYTQMFTRAVLTALLIAKLQLDAVPIACAGGWIVMVVWEVGLILYWKRQGRIGELQC